MPFDYNLLIRIPNFDVFLSSPPYLLSPPIFLPIFQKIHLSHLLKQLDNGGFSVAWRCRIWRHSSRIYLLCLPVSSISIYLCLFCLTDGGFWRWNLCWNDLRLRYWLIVDYLFVYFKRLLRLLCCEVRTLRFMIFLY